MIGSGYQAPAATTVIDGRTLSGVTEVMSEKKDGRQPERQAGGVACRSGAAA